MLQWIIKRLDPQKAEEFLKEIEEKYPKNRQKVDIWFFNILFIIFYNYFFSFVNFIKIWGIYATTAMWCNYI